MRKMQGPKDPSRRRFLKYAVAAAGAIGLGSGGYWITQASQPSLPSKKEPIVIGQQATATGFLAAYGFWYAKTVKAAVDYVNEQGGIDGRPIRLVIEDDASDPTTGIRKLQRLILDHKADFVIGSTSSAVNLQSASLAKELKTPYFPIGEAHEITSDRGNRYIFRAISEVRGQIQSIGKWAIENVAKRWTVAITAYAFGFSHRDIFSQVVKENGGEVLKILPFPIGTKDFVPFLSQIPKETEAVYHVVVGSAEAAGFLLQLRDFGFRGQKLGFIDSVEGFDVDSVREALENSWIFELFPRRLSGYDTASHRKYRELVGVDEEGREVGNPNNVATYSHMWAPYETVFLIKKGIEMSGWRNRADTPKFIKALENIGILNEGLEHPQGEKLLRSQDHQCFTQHWLSVVENGRLQTRRRLPRELSIYPPPVDYTREEL